MRLIGQTTPNQGTEWDHGPVGDLIVRTDSNVSDGMAADPEHLEKCSQEIRQHSPTAPANRVGSTGIGGSGKKY